MDHLQFLLLGLGNGAVYAALGLALVLVFRSSGVLNFAVGAMALYAAYTYAFLTDGRLFSPIPGTPVFIDLADSLPTAVAIAGALVVSTVLSLVAYLAIFRPLRHAPPVASAVASLGLMIMLQGVMAQRVGTRPISVSRIFPRGTFGLGDATIQLDRIWLALTIVILTLVLRTAFGRTSFGLQTRAASSNHKGALVSGLAPNRIAAANWAISGAITGLSGILIAPIVPLVPVSYTLFVIPAMASALLGQFRAMLPTVAAALALGMLQSEATFLQVRLSWLPHWIVPRSGLPELLPLVMVVTVLVVRARPLVSRGVALTEDLGAAPQPRRVLLPSLAGLVAGTAAIFTFGSEWRLALVTSLIFGVVALSLVLVTGYGGQISLAQLTLAGVAGFLLSTFGQDWGIPFPIAPLMAATGATVVGVALGLPAIRVRGLGLGVVTLALAVALEAVWFRNNDFNGGVEGARTADPSLLGIDLDIGAGLAFPREEFAMLCLVTLVGLSAGVAAIRRSRFGSSMMAVRVNERAAAAAGIDVVRVKLRLFALGAFVAGIGGALTAYKQGVASFDLFTTLSGLGVFATVYLAGITSVSGAVLAGFVGSGGVVFKALDDWVSLGDWYNAATGLLLVVTVISLPEGIVGGAQGLRSLRRRPPPEPTDRPELEVSGPPPPRAATEGWSREAVVLSVEGLSVTYGNVVAVNHVDFEARAGSIVGLIGPNGAGKTTLLDAMTGFVPHDGDVRAAGRSTAELASLHGLGPHERARLGIVRTFQAAQLCDDLTVDENLAIGLAAGGRSTRVREVLDAIGLDDVVSRRAGELSHGQRQLVALGRALVANPRVLLLDEPASGLDSAESRWLGQRLRSISGSGVTILLVEHDMNLVLQICDELVVLDFGTRIAAGRPDVVRRDRAVTAAYLGRTGGAA